MNAIAKEHYASNPTPAELKAVLGSRWAICRKTPRNQERYGRCITRKEYQRAVLEAFDTRGFPNTTYSERSALRAFGFKTLQESVDALFAMRRTK